MALLETISAALTTKAAAGMAAATLAGGGIAVAVDTANVPDETEPAQEQLADLSDDGDEQAETAQIFAETMDTPENGELDEGTEDEDAESEGRSDDVHGALTEDGELRPGDEGFGEAVADNARENGRDFGENVADTASEGASERADEHRAEQSEDAGTQSEDAGSQADDAGTQSQEPEHVETDGNEEQRDSDRPDADDEANVDENADNASQRGENRP